MFKIKLKKGAPSDIYCIYESSLLLDDILKTIKTDKKTIKIFGLQKFTKENAKFSKFIEGCLNIKTCRELNHTNFDKHDGKDFSFIKQGYSQKFDKVVKIRNDNNNVASSNPLLQKKHPNKLWQPSAKLEPKYPLRGESYFPSSQSSF